MFCRNKLKKKGDAVDLRRRLLDERVHDYLPDIGRGHLGTAGRRCPDDLDLLGVGDPN